MNDLTTASELQTALTSEEADSSAPSSAGGTVLRPLPRLQALARRGRQADERARGLGMTSWSDDLGHLSDERRASWRRVLSSVATTEGVEATVMEPLLKASLDPETHEYLEVHSADERRHHELLAGYLKHTFGFVKREKTFSDRVFYERVLPAVSQGFRFRPLYGYALLYCYERFALAFYGPLKAKAQADGAQNLLSVLQAIEKDEHRHIAGMEYLVKAEIRRVGGLRAGDLTALGALLSLMLLDINMGPWAFHNREIRSHLKTLGISPDEVTAIGARARAATLQLLASAGNRPDSTTEGASHVASG